jgi:hypothetical protein
MSPSDKMAQLYPQALGSFFVTFYDSQGYGGGILTRLHTGRFSEYGNQISVSTKAESVLISSVTVKFSTTEKDLKSWGYFIP